MSKKENSDGMLRDRTRSLLHKRGVNINVAKFNNKLHLINESLKTNPNPTKDTVKSFLVYACKKLGIKKIPKVVLDRNKKRVLALRALACYNVTDNEVWVYIRNRNTADILRSLAHELVHARQKEVNTGGYIDGSTGSNDENEANSIAGILLRTYGKLNPEIYD